VGAKMCDWMLKKAADGTQGGKLIKNNGKGEKSDTKDV
jgi:hypothetical protein